MKLQSQRTGFFLGAAAALMLTFSTAAVYPQFTQTGDATPAAPSTETPAVPGRGRSMEQSMGRYGIGGDSDELLAEALGITTEELQAAYQDAANAALDQAVAEDLLTQTQADNLRQRLESAAGSGFAFHLGSRGMNLLGSDTIDPQALLAEALGITTDELDAAYADAEAAALAQTVEAGQLTQEEADLMTARRALREYLATQQQTYEELVQGALDAGAITQEQTDLLLENQPSFGGRGFGIGRDFDFGRGMDFGHGMMPDMGGRGMPFGHGMLPGMGGHGMDGGRRMHGGQDWGRGGDNSQDTQPDDSGAQSSSSFLVPSGSM